MYQDLANNPENNSAEIPKVEEVAEHQKIDVGALSPLLAYGLHRISEMPEVRKAVDSKIEDCKEYFKDLLDGAKEGLSDLSHKVTDGIKDFCMGVYENVSEFFNPKPKPLPFSDQYPESVKLYEGITEGREFGLDKCTEAAIRIFNPGVISEWGNLTDAERRGIAISYADEVAKAFELEFYKGVYIEKLDPGILGYNNGDGSIHLTEELLDSYTTPFEIMDTITHELRHQYQDECVRGYHDVTDEVRTEWAVASAIYNYDYPSCYDPWGYKFNPLEIDSNYAGNTVVRNVSSQLFNDLAKA